MEENNRSKKRLRKVSSWMTDAVTSINNEDAILAIKKIVLKVLRYMEENNLTQKQLAEKLGVSPQYVNKFLHGQDDIKVSTAIRYGKILGINLIEIPEEAKQQTVVFYQENYRIESYSAEKFRYNRRNGLYLPFNKKQYAYN